MSLCSFLWNKTKKKRSSWFIGRNSLTSLRTQWELLEKKSSGFLEEGDEERKASNFSKKKIRRKSVGFYEVIRIVAARFRSRSSSKPMATELAKPMEPGNLQIGGDRAQLDTCEVAWMSRL